LEVGYGTLGWLGELISWGVSEKRLHGIEIDLARARRAQEVLPIADLRVGDATELPWDNEHFQLVVASTVFTSILEPRIRQMIAGEITRVLTPGGALLWYDFAVNNPRNPQVRKVSRRELQSLFPELRGTIRWLTLAAPLARWISNKSWVLATFASALPVLQTHLMAVFVKEDS
jgi:ubiquinone/menaquinone biosynthesis C-methylase UbiE